MDIEKIVNIVLLILLILYLILAAYMGANPEFVSNLEKVVFK